MMIFNIFVWEFICLVIWKFENWKELIGLNKCFSLEENINFVWWLLVILFDNKYLYVIRLNVVFIDMLEVN